MWYESPSAGALQQAALLLGIYTTTSQQPGSTMGRTIYSSVCKQQRKKLEACFI
jgi:hypothetical protein